MTVAIGRRMQQHSWLALNMSHSSESKRPLSDTQECGGCSFVLLTALRTVSASTSHQFLCCSFLARKSEWNRVHLSKREVNRAEAVVCFEEKQEVRWHLAKQLVNLLGVHLGMTLQFLALICCVGDV